MSDDTGTLYERLGGYNAIAAVEMSYLGLENGVHRTTRAGLRRFRKGFGLQQAMKSLDPPSRPLQPI